MNGKYSQKNTIKQKMCNNGKIEYKQKIITINTLNISEINSEMPGKNKT